MSTGPGTGEFDGMLSGCRVIDATDGRAMLAGRILADLGADVVQLEPARGARTRRPHPRSTPGRSNMWSTLAAGKSRLLLDLDVADDRERFVDLCGRADVLLHSGAGGILGSTLQVAELPALASELVVVTITAFGLGGPKSGAPASDLTLWAAGGPMEPLRDGSRPPLRVSVPQAWLHAAADAVVGALLGLLGSEQTGRGQVVDVSVQASVTLATLGWSLSGKIGETARPGGLFSAQRPDQSGSGSTAAGSMRRWECADGFVELNLSMGPATGAFTNRLFAWIAEERGDAVPFRELDWREVPAALRSGDVDATLIEAARAVVKNFLACKAKREILEQSLARRLLAVPVHDLADVAADAQLASRGFWVDVAQERGGVAIPGRFAHVSGAPGPTVRGAAPAADAPNDDPLRRWAVRDRRSAGATAGAAPVDGLRVLDLSWVVAGPLIGRTLADFGATVIRVESAARIDTARVAGPFVGGQWGPENSALYGTCNAGKLGVALDLSTEPGREVVRDLAAWADVVIESFAPGRLAAWGLGYDRLAAGHEDLIMLSTSMTGQTGPHARLAGFGNVGASLSGFQALAGWPDRPPVGPFGAYTDYVAPRFSLATLLAALRHRERTGRGCWIDVSQVECGVMFLSPELHAYRVDGQLARARGNADADHVLHGVYPCRSTDDRGRYVAIAAADDEQWERLAAVLGLRPDEPMSSPRAAGPAVPTIDDLVSERTRAWDADELQDRLLDAGVPAHVVADGADLAADPQLAALGHFVEVPHPIHGRMTVEAPRYRLSATPGRVRGAAPTLGQHTRQVLTQVLGYDVTRVDRLQEEGVLR
ncbi:CoA transferase [Polymorphospora sp. NPDC051019]|uniref:CaiB/BaiF CoA-transferase family protein n=1 Tax=Polymorphospora sp. NPDC051019 TaxID=3155725 RepID=UPI003414AE9B